MDKMKRSGTVVALLAVASTAFGIDAVASPPTISELAQIFEAQLARIQTLEIEYENSVTSLDAAGEQIVKGEEHYLLRVSGEKKYAEKKAVLFYDGQRRETFEKYALTPQWSKYVVQRAGEEAADGFIDEPHRRSFAFFDPVFGVFQFGMPIRSLAEKKNIEVRVNDGMYEVSRKIGDHLAELIVIDPARGFLPVRHSGFGIDGGSVVMEVVSAVEVEDGLWLPTEIRIKNVLKNHRVAQSDQRWKVTAYAVNEPLPAESFEFTFPANTDISDNVSGLKYHLDEPGDGSKPPPVKADTAIVDPSVIRSPPATDREGMSYPSARFLILMSLGTASILTAALLKWTRKRRREYAARSVAEH